MWWRRNVPFAQRNEEEMKCPINVCRRHRHRFLFQLAFCVDCFQLQLPHTPYCIVFSHSVHCSTVTSSFSPLGSTVPSKWFIDFFFFRKSDYVQCLFGPAKLRCIQFGVSWKNSSDRRNSFAFAIYYTKLKIKTNSTESTRYMKRIYSSQKKSKSWPTKRCAQQLSTSKFQIINFNICHRK